MPWAAGSDPSVGDDGYREEGFCEGVMGVNEVGSIAGDVQ
jgi:hypothetical protein